MSIALPVLVLALGGFLQTVPFTTVAEGQHSAIEERREVTVRTPAEWKALLKEMGSDEKMPAVDFSKAMIVGVFLGQRNTGGHRAIVTGVDRTDGGLTVTWRDEQPPADAIVTQMLSYPYHLVRVERTDGPVAFKRAPAKR